MTYRPYNKITSSAVSDERVNNSGVTMLKGTPARINSSGELDFIDVSSDTTSLSVVGIVATDISNGSSGGFLTTGKIENITTSANLGDVVWVDKTGALTNIPPAIGVNSFLEGDAIIRVGVIAKNQDNPSLKDLIVTIEPPKYL